MLLSCLLVGPLALLPAPARAAEPFAFKDGDRVVLLGNTLIEREQRYGYWETALTALHPNKDITFRNLGWSGDTVWGEARARFGGPNEGFRHLKEHVLALKPTVIILGYGANESFAGEAGLPNFQKGLDTLLDTLAPTKARIVILSPLKQEDLGRPLPDPTEQNKNIRLYRDVLKTTADKRGHFFVDFYDLRAAEERRLTDNGIHLTVYGYRRTAEVLTRALCGRAPLSAVDIDVEGSGGSFDFQLDELPPAGFVAKDVGDSDISNTQFFFDALLEAGLSKDDPAMQRALKFIGRMHFEQRLKCMGLAAGKHALFLDGKKIETATAAEWAKGVVLPPGPELEQVEKLRQTIIEKNRTYFHRWRPQNETYLFLFRKNEQGQNAKEIPEFDPYIEALEMEISRLKEPATHRYELRLEK
jgi:lysophospholipase L1-like esterase